MTLQLSSSLVRTFTNFNLISLFHSSLYNIIITINAGQETTALLLSFALIMIHQHPQVKQR